MCWLHLFQNLRAHFGAFVDIGFVLPDCRHHAAAGLETLTKLALGVRHALLHLLRPQVFVVVDYDVVGNRRENRPGRCLTP